MPLPKAQGPDISYKDRDSEGIAYDPDSGQYWVSFEQRHAIRRYSGSLGRQTGIMRPREMQDWPNNKGAESIIRLKDGRFLVIAESVDDRMHPALLFSGDPVERGTRITSFKFRPPTGYRVTDGVQLPDGRIAILNRSIGFPRGFSAKISLLNLPNISRDSTVSAKVIASLAAPLLIDNMEGIAVTREGQNTILWLISDNNFSIFQRTILMKFRLPHQPDNKRPRQQPIALRRSFLLLGDFFFHFTRIGRELLVRSLQQPVVETANMLNRTQAVGRNAKLVALLKSVRQQGNILQVWQECALCLVVGVAHIVADQTALTGEFADARHDVYPV